MISDLSEDLSDISRNHNFSIIDTMRAERDPRNEVWSDICQPDLATSEIQYLRSRVTDFQERSILKKIISYVFLS